MSYQFLKRCMKKEDNRLGFDENKRLREAEEDSLSKQIEWQTQMECNRRTKKAAVIEIHFHLDGWAEHFSEEMGSVLM